MQCVKNICEIEKTLPMQNNIIHRILNSEADAILFVIISLHRRRVKFFLKKSAESPIFYTNNIFFPSLTCLATMTNWKCPRIYLTHLYKNKIILLVSAVCIVEERYANLIDFSAKANNYLVSVGQLDNKYLRYGEYCCPVIYS